MLFIIRAGIVQALAFETWSTFMALIFQKPCVSVSAPVLAFGIWILRDFQFPA
jgi:hypothetical protein